MGILHDTSILPPEEQFEYWRDVVCEKVFETEAEQFASDPFSARIELHTLGTVDLCHGQFPQHRMSRGPAQISRLTEPAYCLHFIDEGAVQNRYREEFKSGPGDILVFDMTVPMDRVYLGDLKATLVHFPKTVLETRARLAADVPLSISGKDGLGALLAGYVRTLAGTVLTLSPEAGRQAGDILCDLMAAAIASPATSSEPVRGGIRSARLAAAQRYILQTITDPSLDAQKVGRHLGVSARYVHKIFETTGLSFGESVILARLDACRQALRMPAEDHRTIADVAFGYGFNDLSGFYKRYRARFGETPGDTRNNRASASRASAA